jgi:uncharacterized protein with FMN-binding domain
MTRGMAAMSASAITAIYLAGYLRTQAADASLGAASAASASPTATSAPAAAVSPSRVAPPALQPFVNRRGSRPGAAGTGSLVPAPTPQPSASGPVSYKDGTYTGQGSSRRGDVQVAVTVQGGRIASVDITRSTTQYPIRDIAALPSEVVQRQTAQVDTVSGATYSSSAFRGAVTQALSKAAA